jgi:hypothetical protein
MKLLNLDSGDEAATPNKKKSKWLKIGIGVSALVLIPTIGSTLAGSISINAGSGVEFGQGNVSTAACDGDITVAPTSALTTTIDSTVPTGSMPESAPYFSMGSISVSAIDGSTCKDVTFIIKAYDIDGYPTPLCSDFDFEIGWEEIDELYVEFHSGAGIENPGWVSSSCGTFTNSSLDPSGDGFFEWEPNLTELYLESKEINTITIESSTIDCTVWCD